MDTIVIVWFSLGVLFIFLEFFIPGLVVVFLGAGALTVALLLMVGAISSILNSITYWFIFSLGYILLVRWFFLRIFPSHSRYDTSIEDDDFKGTIVDVIEQIESDNTNGRIRFQDSSWPAISSSRTIASGEKARLVIRDNLSWIVEPLEK